MNISLKASPSKRLYYTFMTLVFLLLVGLVAGAYGTNQLLTTRANKVTSLKAKSLALAQEQLSLTKSKEEIKQYASLQKITQTVVPEDKDQAESVREIVNIAAANGISLETINFPASTLGFIAGGGSTSSTPSATTTPSPAASANSSASRLSQLTPVKNIPGVYDLLITVQSDPNKPVKYSLFVNFLSGLEHNRRTAEISTITLQPSTNDRNLLSFTLTLNEYIKP
jgi:hypothetical protein